MHNYGSVPVSDIPRLIEAGETLAVEFKGESRHPLNDRDLVEAVACLANSAQGGVLLVGVEDDKTVTGARPRHGATTDPLRVQAYIVNATIPPLSVSASLAQVQGKDILVIEVPPATMAVGTKKGTFTRRALRVDGTPQCVPLSAYDILSLGYVTTGRDYALTPVPGVQLGDLDPRSFDLFRSLCGHGGGDRTLAEMSDSDIARALRVSTPSGEITLGAVLLFGTEALIAAHIPAHEVLFQEIRGGQVTASPGWRVSILRAAMDLEELLALRNSEQEFLSGMVRVAVPRFPQRVVREAIANALVHRDYTELGPVNVQVSDDALTVRSPGGLPPGITLDNMLYETAPRSPVLADAFKRAGLVDRAGKGIGDMYRALLTSGRGEPDYSRTTDHSVTVVIPTAGIDLDMMRFVLEYEKQNPPLELRDLRLLHEIRNQGATSPAELAESLDLSLGIVRPALTSLVERGILEVRGSGRGRQYHLSSGFYERAEDRGAYVRVRPVDPIQQEQMVLTYVQSYGSITRGQAAELCRIGVVQARSLLKSMVDAGTLQLRGERRGSHYTLPDTP